MPNSWHAKQPVYMESLYTFHAFSHSFDLSFAQYPTSRQPLYHHEHPFIQPPLYAPIFRGSNSSFTTCQTHLLSIRPYQSTSTGGEMQARIGIVIGKYWAVWKWAPNMKVGPKQAFDIGWAEA